MNNQPSLSQEQRDAIGEALITSPETPSRIDGAVLHRLTTHRDPRGTLTELLRADWPEVYGDELPFAQVYTSTTAPGVARDVDKWHVHQYQTDRFYCLRGRIVVAIADPRPDSLSKGRLALVELAAGEDGPAPMLVTIPPRTLHGFVVTSANAATLLNFPNRIYDPSDEGRIPFTDATVSFPDGTAFSYDAISQWYAHSKPGDSGGSGA